MPKDRPGKRDRQVGVDVTLQLPDVLQHALIQWLTRESSGSADRKLDLLLAHAEAQAALGVKLMSSLDNLKAQVAEIATVTNDMAAVVNDVIAADAAEDATYQEQIDALKAQIAGTPVTEADLDALGADLTGQAATLRGLAEALKAVGTGTPIPDIPPVEPPVEPPV